MLDDMALRKLTEQTQRTYVRAVERFTRFFGTSPDLASPEDQRRFQMKLVSEGVSTTTINATITGLRFFFEVTLDRPEALKKMSPLKTPQKLPTVLSVDEVKRLLEAAPGLKARSALCVAYGAGLRASEVVHLKIADIDSERMILRIEQGKGRRDRYAMLAPSLLELLRRWYREAHTRGRMLPNGWLFPGQNQIDFIDAGLIGSRLDEAVELPGGERQYENVTI
jgi:integrase